MLVRFAPIAIGTGPRYKKQNQKQTAVGSSVANENDAIGSVFFCSIHSYFSMN
jgi:hypothetical protein